jgi:hypothetical protein
VTSLAKLENPGLYSAYLELAIPEQHSKWAITTANLRKLWTDKQLPTSYSELEAALLLASICSEGFEVLDIRPSRGANLSESEVVTGSCNLYRQI